MCAGKWKEEVVLRQSEDDAAMSSHYHLCLALLTGCCRQSGAVRGNLALGPSVLTT